MNFTPKSTGAPKNRSRTDVLDLGLRQHLECAPAVLGERGLRGRTDLRLGSDADRSHLLPILCT
jgi:hypothetical protein